MGQRPAPQQILDHGDQWSIHRRHGVVSQRGDRTLTKLRPSFRAGVPF
jgi:hypothetical protein